MSENTGPTHVNAHDLAAVRKLVADTQVEAKAKFPYLAGELERLYGLGAAGSILELMEATWVSHAEIGEPFSDLAACQIAINELIDYAREHGCRVTFDNTEIGSPYGVCLHPPEQEQP